MAKRKLGMSIIVLIVAATTLVSGTYAWFLVGGFAELFDLGFEVIEAEGGIELQGSAGHAYTSASEGAEKVEWGAALQRDCFALAGDPTSAVTTDAIPMSTVEDTNGNSIIDSAETKGAVSLAPQTVTELTASAADANRFDATLDLPGVSGSAGSDQIVVRIWIEGNDTDCTGEKLSAKYLSAKITFGSSAAESGE